MRGEHGELVVVEPEGLVGCANLAADHVSDRGDQAIAGLATVGVVDPAEPVDVDQPEREAVAVAALGGEQRPHPLRELRLLERR